MALGRGVGALLGEPLRGIPWDFEARTSGDVAAYEAGGKLRDAIPEGWLRWITLAVLAGGIVGRLVSQGSDDE